MIDIQLSVGMLRPKVLEKVRSIPNPYNYSTHKLGSDDFVGRLKPVQDFISLLDQYLRTAKLKNVTIRGDKSIGKSTLLNRFSQLLQDYDFAIYECELSIDNRLKLDEFEFFKNLLDSIYHKYAPINDSCLDARQQDIWYSLTTLSINHEANYMERKIGFATSYYNKINGKPQSLSYDTIERDFQLVLDALRSPEKQYKGFAILIDEFQELSRNSFILDSLRKLSENIPGLIIIGAGLKQPLDDRSFDKFIRTSIPIYLEKLSKIEILELIFKPIEIKAALSRFEVQDLFEQKTVNEIIARSGGNPLDIKILCSNIFEYFSTHSELNHMQINLQALKEAMKYYASISEKSMRIKNALETCTREQLSNFKHLFFYEGLSLRSIIWLTLAFQPLTPENEQTVKDKVITQLKDIYDFGLFELSGSATNLSDLDRLTPVALSQESYRFAGDKFDMLYTTYFYEELTKSRLYHNNGRTLEDLLCEKLARRISDEAKQKFMPTNSVSGEVTQFVNNLQATYSYDELIDEFMYLSKISAEKKPQDKILEQIRVITQKYDLRFPAMIAHSLDLLGYCVLISHVLVKSKKVVIMTFLPIGKDQPIQNVQPQIIDRHSSYKDSSFNDYMIEIENCFLTWLARDALDNIIRADLDVEFSFLFKRTKERDFNSACKSASRILAQGLKIIDGQVLLHGNWFNNYAFCLINIGDLELAKKIFEDLKDKQMLSKVNLAYVYLLKGDWKTAKDILKDVLKKHQSADFNVILHAAIIHPDLNLQHRIFDDVNIINCVLWNLALISIEYENSSSKANSYMKKISIKSEADRKLHLRVKNWVNYFDKKPESALEVSKKLLGRIETDSPLYRDIQKDIEIFSHCCPK